MKNEVSLLLTKEEFYQIYQNIKGLSMRPNSVSFRTLVDKLDTKDEELDEEALLAERLLND